MVKKMKSTMKLCLVALGLILTVCVGFLAGVRKQDTALVESVMMLKENAIAKELAIADQAYFGKDQHIAIWELHNLVSSLEQNLPERIIDQKRLNYYLFQTHVRLSNLYHVMGDSVRAQKQVALAIPYGKQVFDPETTNWDNVISTLNEADQRKKESGGVPQKQ